MPRAAEREDTGKKVVSVIRAVVVVVHLFLDFGGLLCVGCGGRRRSASVDSGLGTARRIEHTGLLLLAHLLGGDLLGFGQLAAAHGVALFLWAEVRLSERALAGVGVGRRGDSYGAGQLLLVRLARLVALVAAGHFGFWGGDSVERWMSFEWERGSRLAGGWWVVWLAFGRAVRGMGF